MKLYECTPNDSYPFDTLTINFDDISSWKRVKGETYCKIVLNIKGVEEVLFEIRGEYKTIYDFQIIKEIKAILKNEKIELKYFTKI